MRFAVGDGVWRFLGSVLRDSSGLMISLVVFYITGVQYGLIDTRLHMQA